MNAMIQLNWWRFIICSGAMVSHAPAKCRSIAYNCSSPSKADPSGVARLPQPNQKDGEVFRRHTFPLFWLMKSKLTKLAAGAGRALVQSYRYRERAARLLHSKWNSRRAMSNAARPSAYWTLYADSAATERAVAIMA